MHTRQESKQRTPTELAPKPLLRVKEFASLLGISEREAYRKINEREITSVLIGSKRVGIPYEAYEQFIQQRTRPAMFQ